MLSRETWEALVPGPRFFLLPQDLHGRKEEEMNFLAHLYLAGDDKGLIVGNLLGDFVKGRLKGIYPAAIERGIALHRRIDSFSGLNPRFLQSKKRIDASFGHYRGVMVDLFYDHFLAKHWGDY